MKTNLPIAIVSLMLVPSTLSAQVTIEHTPTRDPEPIDGNGIWSHFAGNAKRNAVPSIAMTNVHQAALL